MFFKKHKGSAFISLLLIASAIISLIAISTARLNSSFNSTFNANSRITSAEQFALSSAAILQATNYDDLVDQPRHSIPNTKYSSAVTLGAEQNLENDVKMRPAEISVYYGNDAEALYTLSTRLYKLPPESLIPVGMIIAWASAKNPDDGTWLECNGQSCAAIQNLLLFLGVQPFLITAVYFYVATAAAQAAITVLLHTSPALSASCKAMQYATLPAVWQPVCLMLTANYFK